MPILTAEGDIFDVGAVAGIDEGWGAVDLGAGARASFGATAEFCHGIDLAVDAAASAFFKFKLLWLLLGKAEGQALAAAGAEAKVKVDINLFETAGLSVTAKHA